MAGILDYLRPSTNIDEARRRFRSGMGLPDEGFMEAQRRARLARSGIGLLGDYGAASINDPSVRSSLPTVVVRERPEPHPLSETKDSRKFEMPGFGYRGSVPSQIDAHMVGEGDINQAQLAPVEGEVVEKAEKKAKIEDKNDPFSSAIFSLLQPTSDREKLSRSLLDFGLALMATDQSNFLSAVGQAGQTAVGQADKRAAGQAERLRTAGYLKQVEGQIEAATNEKHKVRDIIVDREGRQYAVTDSGLTVLSHEGKVVQTFNKDDPRYVAAAKAYSDVLSQAAALNGEITAEDIQNARDAFAGALGATERKADFTFDPKTGKLIPVK